MADRLLASSFMSRLRWATAAANGPGSGRSRRFATGPWTVIFAIALSLASQSCSTTSSTSESTVVPLAAVSSSVPACGSGYAHPNVCCGLGDAQSVVCRESPGAPFSPCDPHVEFTYPDPRSCCPLDGEGSCVDVDPDAGAVSSATTLASCLSPCQVGEVPPPSAPWPSCADNPMGVACECCFPGNGGCAVYGECNCPPQPPCNCEGPPRPCGPCPSGWQAQPAIDLCCRDTSAGATQCFSLSGNTGI